MGGDFERDDLVQQTGDACMGHRFGDCPQPEDLACAGNDLVAPLSRRILIVSK